MPETELRCVDCGAEKDSEGWCPNYCMTGECGCWYHAEEGIPCPHDLAKAKPEREGREG